MSKANSPLKCFASLVLLMSAVFKGVFEGLFFTLYWFNYLGYHYAQNVFTVCAGADGSDQSSMFLMYT